MHMIYRDRREAGRRLARHLMQFAGDPRLVVLALPRGGVPVGQEVARAIAAPFDVIVVRKLGAPEHEDFAIGAVATGGIVVRNEEALHWLQIPDQTVERIAARERKEVELRDHLYRGQRPPVEVRGRIVVLVDDGLPDSSMMRCAVEAVRKRGASRIIVAAPVGAVEACRDLHDVTDDVICPVKPEPFESVGLWYDDFHLTTDTEVQELLQTPAAHAVLV